MVRYTRPMLLSASSLEQIKLFGFFLAAFAASFSNSFCGIGLGIYTGGLILGFLIHRDGIRPPLPLMTLFFLLLASLLVSLFISDFFWISFKGLGKYLQGFLLLYAGIELLTSTKRLKLLLTVLIASYGLAIASGLYQEWTGVDFLRGNVTSAYHLHNNADRLTGPFKHCNDFGTFLIPGLAIALGLFLHAIDHRSARPAILSGIFFALLSFLLIRTLSRGALLSAVIALFIVILFSKQKKWLLAAFFLMLALLWVIPSPIADRLHQMPSLRAESNSERVLLMEIALKMIGASPFFGLGLNTYSDQYPLFKPADYPAFMYSHNSYLQMAAEIGLIGVTLYFGYIFILLARSVIAARRAPDSFEKMIAVTFFAGGTGFLFNCLFESALQSTRLRHLFWTLVGALTAITLNRLLDRTDPKP